MPYQRVGALKVSDHWVRSPLLLNRACQTCHAVPEAELQGRVLGIQDRHQALLPRAAKATTDMLDAIVAAKKAGVPDTELQPAAALHRKAQWRLDFVAAENSMGVPRAAGAGADPGRGHRLRAPGPTRGRPRLPEAMTKRVKSWPC
jgi:nitrite reductase (cytochrome c-552)